MNIRECTCTNIQLSDESRGGGGGGGAHRYTFEYITDTQGEQNIRSIIASGVYFRSCLTGVRLPALQTEVRLPALPVLSVMPTVGLFRGFKDGCLFLEPLVGHGTFKATTKNI